MSDINKQEVLNDIKEYIEKVNSQIEFVIQDVRENFIFEDLIDVLDGLAYCYRGLELTKELHSISVDEEFIKEKISEILEAVENEDFGLVADIVEYEILEKIQDLNTNLQNL